jgi:predicted enzyme related to lactoylglutathione lyase
MWMPYFTVEDVDTKAKEIDAASGTVFMPPFDVLESGRMTVAADPTGAMFCLWQAKDMIGAQITDEPNTLGWAEIATPNTGKARAFYTQVLGWVADDIDMGDGGTYTLFKLGDISVAGMMGTQSPDQPAGWNVYFDVADADATVEAVKSNGGNVLMDPDDVPNAGRVAFVTDPQGAPFGVIQPEA